MPRAMAALVHELRLFFVALQFLPRLPVPVWVGWEPAHLNRAVRHFALVGGLVGTVGAAVVWCAQLVWPPMVAATLAVATTLWLTAAFHEDGLADTFDALLGGAPRDTALAIMKDSRIGSYGSLALVLAVLTKVALLVLLAQYSVALAVAALFGAHVTSRLVPLWVIRTLPHVGDTARSKSKPLADTIGNAGLLAAMTWWLAAMALLLWLQPGAPWPQALLGALLALAWMWRLLKRRLQGFTGDGLGATQQISELAFYLGLLLGLPA